MVRCEERKGGREGGRDECFGIFLFRVDVVRCEGGRGGEREE